ncbi:dihydrofolate reductase family protein [Litorihabitans aurantiacus]|uniref:Deaminase n=1 Tax=Litorihabitans aurantiacus TaxID=1930061 RepID=A0AA37XDV0_9MICO|nr:dihydrofolate reductase family protein [Litorihabitans aurantiacus]GMA31262.1 deaminase [Litorihabitans aurantiacus]
MRRLIYFVATTLDGFIAGPDGDVTIFPFDEDYGRELARDWSDALPTPALAASGLTPPRSRWDAVVMGRGTFQPAIDAGLADPYAHLDTYVVSTTLEPADHPAVTIVDRDPDTFVADLLRRPGGDVWLCGGGRLAATLAPLVDRLVLKVNPVVAGAGTPLFDGEAPVATTRWHLVEQHVYGNGVVMLTYDRDRTATDDGDGDGAPLG